ncbi:hypothetical protein [Vagococcus fluvialis]|uniref:hypothetical protein n=1 Tax=Vagococcus fluvialis TaxID=2738 RepID=UPI001D0A6D2A|nr:hypothetical protein [Vagococcus fluvialis]UDM70310.1 hypothetical protein K5L00_09195 [Vagococcus fluvialis]UDM77728.1 hypothetical protein K5K98_04735 [Vagococcus fluvialis]UDM81999.1 hypothetical protein K5K96_11675 [Vagococcus fluvialis]
MKTEDDFFSHREWLKYLENQKQAGESKVDFKKLSMKELNKYINESEDIEAIEYRRTIISKQRKNRITQVDRDSSKDNKVMGTIKKILKGRN